MAGLLAVFVRRDHAIRTATQSELAILKHLNKLWSPLDSRALSAEEYAPCVGNSRGAFADGIADKPRRILYKCR